MPDTDNYILDETTPVIIAESYRKLRDNIIASIGETGKNRIGFVSAGQGEGKTISCINTALSFSETGKRVIVIDCCFQNPTVSEKLDLDLRPGLSDIIAGKSRVADAIRHYYRIDVITAGTGVKNPDGMLSSGRMASFLKKVGSVYDYVFVSLPPVLLSNGARCLAESVDSFVFTARRNKTNLKEFQTALNRMKSVNASVMGIVYTNASLEEKGGKRRSDAYR